MTSRVVIAGIGLAAAGLAAYLWLAQRSSTTAAGHRALLERYCVDCHNDAEFAGGVSFEGRDPGAVRADPALWEAAVRKLRAGLMPPAGEPRPAEAMLEGLRGWLTAELDAASREDPNPGAPALRRLNRTEYGNAIRDLLDLHVDVTTLLPADDSREGFDNIADALSISPSHMQAYVSAAARISRLAVGDMSASPALTTYPMPRGMSQAAHLAGLPFGTRGGLVAEHVFPVDAEYEITVRRALGSIFLDSVGNEDEVELAIDGERVSLIAGRGGRPIRIPVSAGPHTLTAAVIPVARHEGVDDLYANLAGSTGVTSIAVMGPFDATGPGDTPSRRRLFVCTPDDPGEPGVARACAGDIVTALVRRAFRRPAEELAASIATVMQFYEEGYARGGFDLGIQHALARVLVDPQFIFRFEHEPGQLAPGESYGVDDYELATRLAFFLWSSIPDDELLTLAEAGSLAEPATLERQVTRMLADPRSEALVTSFARQWLGLRALEAARPVSREFDANLRYSLGRETELLFASILEEDRSVLDLLTADYTFVDERLARHYGMPGIRGSRFRRVPVEDDARRGLLGHGSILTTTSSPTRTSPVMRGAWVLENLLGTPPPSPPPGVETDLDEPAAAGSAEPTLRERLERHREDPGCASCHSIIDPIGFALEPFDLTGHWRETDQGRPIDATGELWDGTRLDGPASLREALVERRELFVHALTERLLTYALGRKLEHYDMPAVRAVVAAAEAEDYRLSAIVRAIARSVPFRQRRKEGQGAGPAGSPAGQE